MNEREIFTAASDRFSPEERKAYLDEACGDDLELRRRVEALLQSHEDAGSFLELPVLADDSTFGSEPTTDPDRVLPFDDQRTQDCALTAEELSLDFLEPCDTPGRLGKIGPYEVIEVIGRGGMGVVLRGFDCKLHRVVAIKLLAPELASNPTAHRRFLREARAAAAVSHDHVVTIHAVEESNRVPGSLVHLPYLVMECVSGKSLQEQIDDTGPLELREVLRIGSQIASGLAAAHAQGLVHRDIKPANILLENGVERVKITDFGLARAVDDVSMTQTGVIAGTPQYMAPEQAQGHFVDHRADLFSLGCVMYAMLTGRSPFRADSTLAVMRRVCEETPRHLQEVNEDTPDWLVEIIDKLLAKDPGERFQSAAEVAELLGKHLAHVQQPSLVAKPVGLGTEATEFVRQPARRACGRGWVVAAVLLLMFGGLAATEATGVTNVREFVATVLRIRTPEGTLVVELDDPEINVTIDGEEITLSNVGPHEIRLSPGRHQLKSTKDGAPVRSEWVTITHGGKQVVKVGLEPDAEASVVVVPEQPEVAPDTTSQIRMLIPEASAMARQDLEKLTKSSTAPKASTIVEKSLTLMLLVLEPKYDNQAKEQFQLTAQGISGPAEIVREIGRVRESPEGTEPGESVTFIHADRITDVTCEVNGDTASGSVSFEMPELYQGKVNYVARRRDGRWQIEEFTMPAYDIHIVREGRGMWEKQSAKPTATLTEVRRFEGSHVDRITCVAVSADGRRLLSGSADATVRLWDVASGEEIRPLLGHTKGVICVAFSPDGRHALSGGIDGSVRLWDVETGKVIHGFEEHEARIAGVAFSPDGRLALSGRAAYGVHKGDVTLRLWDVESGDYLRSLAGENLIIWSVAFSPDGRWALAGGTGLAGNHRIGLWDAETGELVRHFLGGSTTVNSVAFSPDGRYVVSGHTGSVVEDGVHGLDPQQCLVRFWDVETGREIRRFQGHSGPVTSVAFSPDGRYVLSGSGGLHGSDGKFVETDDNTVRLWDVKSGRELWRADLDQRVAGVAFLPDGRHVVSAGGDYDGRPDLRLWQLPKSLWPVKQLTEIRRFEGHTRMIVSVAVSPDGRFLLSGDQSGGVLLSNLETGKAEKAFARHEGSVYDLSFGPDGTAYSCSTDRTARRWDVPSGEEIRRYVGHTGWVRALAVSPDGKHLLTGSTWFGRAKDQQGIPADNSLRLWDVETGKEVRRFEDVAVAIRDVAFAPDGKTIVAGGQNSMLGLWDVETGKRIRPFMAPTTVMSVAFSPDGAQVASSHLGGLEDGKWFDPEHAVIIFWDVKSGEEIRRLRGHTAMINSIAFSPDGRFLASADGGGHDYTGWHDAEENTVRIWDAATGEELDRADLGTSVQSVAFTPDGRYLVTGGGHPPAALGHADLRLWKLPIEPAPPVAPAATVAEPETQEIPPATVSKEDEKHEQAVAKIEELGGEVRTLEDEKNGEVFTIVGLRKQWKGGEGGLVYLKDLTNLKMLDLNGTKVTDATLAHLKGLVELRMLNLNNAEVTDAGLVHLEGLTNLEHLLLGGTRMTDAGLVRLMSFTELQELDLKNTQVTEGGVKTLQQALPNLKTVYR